MDRLVAHCSMFYYKADEQLDIFFKNCQGNISESDDYRRSCTKYYIDLIEYYVKIALPPEKDNGQFPNLGPKVNHNFEEINSNFDQIEHPRWGVLIGVLAQRDILPGEEILLNYGYKDSAIFPLDHPWYFQAKEKYEKEKKPTII